jgi:hypothetical protein
MQVTRERRQWVLATAVSAAAGCCLGWGLATWLRGAGEIQPEGARQMILAFMSTRPMFRSNMNERRAVEREPVESWPDGSLTVGHWRVDPGERSGLYSNPFKEVTFRFRRTWNGWVVIDPVEATICLRGGEREKPEREPERGKPIGVGGADRGQAVGRGEPIGVRPSVEGSRSGSGRR